jgi:hypothetical protein
MIPGPGWAQPGLAQTQIGLGLGCHIFYLSLVWVWQKNLNLTWITSITGMITAIVLYFSLDQFYSYLWVLNIISNQASHQGPLLGNVKPRLKIKFAWKVQLKCGFYHTRNIHYLDWAKPRPHKIWVRVWARCGFHNSYPICVRFWTPKTWPNLAQYHT